MISRLVIGLSEGEGSGLGDPVFSKRQGGQGGGSVDVEAREGVVDDGRCFRCALSRCCLRSCWD